MGRGRGYHVENIVANSLGCGRWHGTFRDEHGSPDGPDLLASLILVDWPRRLLHLRCTLVWHNKSVSRVISHAFYTQTVLNLPSTPESGSLVLATPTCGRSTFLVQTVPTQRFTLQSYSISLVPSCLMCVSCHPRSPAVVAAGSFNGEVRTKIPYLGL